MKRILCVVALAMLTMMSGYAQDSLQVKDKVQAMAKKYDSVKGVECVTVEKGSGLGLVKMMFNKQFGKDFMKGVTSITIIEYSDASPETIQALRNDLDAFTSLLEEFNFNEKNKSANNDYVRCFATISKEDGTLSDFIFALEDEESKMFLYMAGVIRVTEL